jgi:hypothetical protein
MVVAVSHQSELHCQKTYRTFTSGSGSMKWWKAVLLACFAAAAVAAQHGQYFAIYPAVHLAGSVAAQNSLVHILSPVPSQQLSTNYVDLNFELVNPGVSGGSADFKVQLDGLDPVSTKDTTYTFIGLNPGQHTISVELVDANDTPVPGGRSMVTFFVVSTGSQHQQGTRVPGMTAKNGDPPELAPASSALPLLSIIGFGVLVGGVASALRTRG